MSKLKNKDILIINESLLYLSQKGTAAWYQVSKNLRAVKAAVAEINATKDDILENCAEKDKDGVIKYEGEGVERKVVWKDADEADKKWEEMMNDEAPEIKFHKFSFDKFGEDVSLDALAIEPLIDVIIED